MKNKIQQMPIFMCLGLSGGMALGAVMGSIPIGMCIGMAVGLCAGLCLDTRKFSEPDDGYQKEEPEEEIIEENEEAGKESDLSE